LNNRPQVGTGHVNVFAGLSPPGPGVTLLFLISIGMGEAEL
jgi:hypothetical protein